MQLPARLENTLRTEATAGLLAAAGVEAVTFLATPLLVPGLADRYGVSPATAGLVSTAQVGSFLLATFGAGRYLRPSAGVVRTALLALVFANLLSAVAPTLPVLLALRVLAGLGMGFITWAAWASSLGRGRHLADVASAGPLAAMVATPVLGMVATGAGPTGIYLVLAVAGMGALRLTLELPEPLAPATPAAGPPARRRSRRGLLGLAAFTLANSAVWVQMSTIGTSRLGLAGTTIGLLMAANAGAGLIGARRDTSILRPTTWLALAGPVVALVILAPHPAVFGAAIVAWGFLFQAGVPTILDLIASRSSHPAAALGEAQSAMAMGRTLGPLTGAAVLGTPVAAAVAVPLLFLAGSRLTAVPLRADSPADTGRVDDRSTGAERDADAGARRPDLGHGVLPVALARAPHHDQVAGTGPEPARRSATGRSHQERS